MPGGDFRSGSRDASRPYHEYRDERSWSDAASRQPPQGYYDDHRSRQDYSRSPKRNELSYDDVPEQESHRGRGSAGYSDHDYEGDRDGQQGYDDGYTRRNYDRTDGYDRGGYSRSRREADDGYGGGRDRRGRSRSPMRNAGTPSDTIILEALPADVTLEEVRESLQRYSGMSRYPSFDVRLPGGRGRRAFVQFASTGDAVEFVEANYPKLLLDFEGRVDGDVDGKTNVYIHFARSREEPESRAGHGQNWTCSVCEYSNYATRNRCKNCGGPQTDALSYRHLLTGESDAGDTPSQILVFYPLASSVTEEVLAVGAAKLELVEKPVAARQPGEPPKLKSTAPTGDTTGFGARPGSLHRVFLMRDRDTNESFKFGFAEFWTVEDAMAAMTKFKKFREFTVASAPVSVSTIHLGVFVPELREVHPGIEALSFNPLFNPAIRVKYWDPHVLPSQKVVNEQPPEGTKLDGDGEDTADAKKSKKRKADASAGSGASKKSVPMAGQMAFWQKRHDEIHDGNTKPNRDQEGVDPNGRAPVKIALSSNGSNQGPIKIALSSTAVAISTGAGASPSTRPSQSITPDPTSQSPSKTPAISYVDKERVCCLLCMMKYKNLDDLSTHERSRNHKTAMEDEEKVKKAKERLARRGIKLVPDENSTQAEDESGPQYRDRAKERREVYGQPKHPSNQEATRKDAKPSVKSREPSPQPAQPAASKGSAMLAKMGWSTGQGLGAKGEGRTEVIETNAYQEGVGLGAEGGKLGDAAELAEKRTTNSYAEYLSSAQDKARERYNRLG